MKSICNFITRYMGIFVLFTALISLSFPELLNRISTSTINPLLGVIMFGMGLTLSTEDFKVVYRRPIDLILGCLAQFTLMPLLALFLVKLFHLSEGLAIGVILVGCCPGGTASNVITYLAKGDVALSVGMTAVSTILAPIVTPLLVWLLAGTLT
ncbi:MAG: bile acid:sodium symporter family protein, partial [Bacteroidaceae bacterium]|nr:bile acid:sodium symporter family protein [Bacteroidaceae bacterium]